jgi:hypothetical protein
LESRAAARAVHLGIDRETQEQLAAQFRNLTPQEQAFIEISDDAGVQILLLRMFREVIIPKHELFGTPLPTAEESRHMRQVSEEVAKIKRERAAHGDKVSLNENAPRKMAEDRVRREHGGRAQTRSTTAEGEAE